FLSPPPPLTSTLFPYTTLFRSLRFKARVASARQRLNDDAKRELDLAAGVNIGTGRADQVAFQLCHFLLSRPDDRPARFVNLLGQDRKSTRLNSSHLVISYAVFC